MKNALQFSQGFAKFHITIILWLSRWWMLAPKFVTINTIHFLDSSKKPFKVTLWWLTTVGKFPHGAQSLRLKLFGSSSRPKKHLGFLLLNEAD